jgi:hypothetical protein
MHEAVWRRQYSKKMERRNILWSGRKERSSAAYFAKKQFSLFGILIGRNACAM